MRIPSLFSRDAQQNKMYILKESPRFSREFFVPTLKFVIRLGMLCMRF
ncbi:hypothetical protein Pan241w_49110 [Gimesia alba]|uniref:Uncharacterized protein n=1 Tax=Gimesia alba TaxID=2527973 RepID=A0A517RLN9_9PLAN|nr:hypothetical protein Pan241w_49110 [Gimesia alba]